MIIAYNVYKVVGHWIMFESQCVDYMALTCMSIVEAPQQLFEINLIQLSLRNLAHCSGMNWYIGKGMLITNYFLDNAVTKTGVKFKL